MDYEKKYKEALEKARKFYNELAACRTKQKVAAIFPELAESEDERIRKALVIMIKVPRKEIFEAQGITKEQALAYLEKPKEPIDTFDTKLFQDGVKEGRRLEREDIEKEYKPADDEAKAIAYREYERGRESGLRDGQKYVLDNAESYGLCKPAEWSEDKFPKDIEKDATQFCFDKGFNITPYQAKEIATHYLMIGHNFGYVEGRKNAHIPAKELGLPSSMDFKQEWSKEDNIGWDEAFACVTRAEKAAKNEEELQNAVTAEKWLKEIKFKYYVHPVKQEWSEDIIRKAVKEVGLTQHQINWLKTNVFPPKQEWSEEDEKMRNALWNLLKIYYAQDSSMTCVGIEAGKFRDWLKSRLPSDEEIKKAYTKGFNDAAFGGKAWKPSDEQMGALNYAYCELFKREDVDHNILGSLQNLIDTLRKL